MKKYKVASLFSGCGGLDLGFTGGFQFKDNFFERNNFDIIFANDIDKDAVHTYQSNNQYFQGHSILESDIRNIASNDIPPFDILLAGFPCQPFSNAGNRKGVNDDNGRGTLWYECERIINYAIDNFSEKPKAFLFENVRGIMSSKTNNGITVPEEIRLRMESLGYKVSMQLIKASDYGVPQNRYRYIIIGIRDDLEAFDFKDLNKVVLDYNLPSLSSNTYPLLLGSILCDIPKDAPQYDLYWKYSPQGQKMVDMIGVCEDGKEMLPLFQQQVPIEQMPATITKGKSWKNINPNELPARFKKIYDDPKKYHAPNFYRRFALGEIAGTITASAQPENCGITHPFENRRMTIREIARIQSFPDDFTFPTKTLVGAYKVIGNAVPPVLGWVMARALQNHLDEALKLTSKP
ncbi:MULTISPECIES: DNA cytosine methyltransferase [unclassified Moraxella]|uniref:DNA cytosine methyltransferase n=1 Tax=unclassified Moraxella TaxID=2685852 RepID=UPI003AF5BA7A